MNFEYSPYILPLIAAACISLIAAVYIWKRRAASGAYALLLMAAGIFEWTLAYALEIMGTNLETKYFWGAIQYFGIALVPYSWLVFSVSYGNLTQFLSRRFLALTGMVPLLTILLAFTNKWHGLIWSEYHIQRNGSFSALGTAYGVWFWVHVGYSYIILLAGTVFVVRALWHKQGAYRGQMLAMLVALLAPWLGNALYLTGKSPIPYLDLTPFAFTITVVALTLAIFGFRLMDITPLARDRVLDAMSDGVIIFNLRDNVVDINQSAARMIGMPVPYAIGKNAAEIFQPWQKLVEQIHASPRVQSEISVGDGEVKRVYEARIAPLIDHHGQATGRILMLHQLSGEESNFVAEASTAHPLEEEPREQDASPGRLWLAEFFSPRKKNDIPLDSRYSPAWARTLERIFTVVLRIIAILGTVAAMAVLPGMRLRIEYWLPLISVITIFWTLALWRRIKLNVRTNLFILTLYGLAIMEVSNYGYSNEAFIYFVAIVVFGTLFDGLRGGIATFFISLMVLTGFGAAIARRAFQPFGILPGELFKPDSLRGMFTTLVAYATVTISLIAFVSVLLRSLNRAWQTELQTLNLLQQERDLLEQHVAERTQSLNVSNEALLLARDQALEASRLKTHLLARVSHELRTPLGSVLGYAELLQDEVYGEVSAEQKDALTKVIESTNYLTHIVNDLLETAQIETRGLSLKLDFFAPEVLLKHVQDRLALSAQSKGLQFKAEIILPFPEKIYSDEKRIQQVLENLCSNAIKFTAQGGVSLRLHQPAPDQWRIEVADTGAGIPKAAQTDIFIPFRQINGKIVHGNRGTGLGLSIVKQIVEIMGGFVEVTSELNKGSVFTVTLPITHPKEVSL